MEWLLLTFLVSLLLGFYGIALYLILGVRKEQSLKIADYSIVKDCFLVELIVNTFKCSAYRVFENATKHEGFIGYDDKLFKRYLHSGEVAGWMRRYMIDVLEGKIVFETSMLG